MRARRLSVVVAGWVALMLTPAAYQVHAQQQSASPAAAPAKTPQRALLDQYCVKCHNERLQSGKMRLDNQDVTNVAANPEVWEKVVRKLRGGVMPPAGQPRPEKAAYVGLATWLETELDRSALAHLN